MCRLWKGTLKVFGHDQRCVLGSFITFSTKTPPCFVDGMTAPLPAPFVLRITLGGRQRQAEKEAGTRLGAGARPLRQTHALTHRDAHCPAPRAAAALQRASPARALRTSGFSRYSGKDGRQRQPLHKMLGESSGEGPRSGASSSFLPDALENLIWVWQSCRRKATQEYFSRGR